jgi:hypothetical protein
MHLRLRLRHLLPGVSRRGLRLAAGAAALAALAAGPAPARAQDGSEGRPLQHTFQRSPFRGAGLPRLEDLRGAPVWIEFWNSTSLASYGVTVPTAVQLQEKYGDELQVLCVEVGGLTHDAMARFVLQYRWAAGRAMWTTESPMSGPARVPWAVVLGPDGEVLASASSLDDGKRVMDALEEAFAARKKGPKGTPASVAKAWGEFAKGRLGRALVVARDAAAKAKGKQEQTVTAASLVEAAVLAAAEARLSRVEAMLASGHYADALAQLEALAKAVDGDEALAGRVTTLRGTLDGDESAAELAADAKLAKLERKLYGKGLDDGLARDLLALATDVSGTKASERARALAALARED